MDNEKAVGHAMPATKAPSPRRYELIEATCGGGWLVCGLVDEYDPPRRSHNAPIGAFSTPEDLIEWLSNQIVPPPMATEAEIADMIDADAANMEEQAQNLLRMADDQRSQAMKRRMADPAYVLASKDTSPVAKAALTSARNGSKPRNASTPGPKPGAKRK